MEIVVTTGAIDGYELGDIAEYPDELAMRLVSRGFAEPAGGEPEAVGEPAGKLTLPEASAIANLSKADLQELCRINGVSDKGTKEELRKRLSDLAPKYDYAPSDADELLGGDEGDEPPVLDAEVPR